MQNKHKHEKMLILDLKTRWNSLLIILDRVLEIQSAVAKTLIDCKIKSDFSEREYIALNDIVLAVAEGLCSSDATLLSADGVFTFIINELNELIEQKFCICKDDEIFVNQQDQ